MARWGRKGLSWYIGQWLDGNAQRPTQTATGWGKRKWSEPPKAFMKSKGAEYGMFKPRKSARSFHSRAAASESEHSSPAPGRSVFKRLYISSASNKHKPGKRSSWKSALLLIAVGSIGILITAFVFVEQNLREPLMHVAKIRVKQLATQAINGAVTDQVATRVASDSLIDWKMDSKGKVSGFMLNYNEHMRITSSTINTVQGILDDLQHVPERIPLGHALDSAIISNYGPKIPISFEPLGAVKVELNTREKNAAINMVLVEVYIKVITEIAIIIPFDMEPEVVETEIPISYLLVVGDVPMYYYDSTGKPIGESAPQAPNIAVPLQQGQGIASGSEAGEGQADSNVQDEQLELEGQKSGSGMFKLP